jgi:hypothetical protein
MSKLDERRGCPTSFLLCALDREDSIRKFIRKLGTPEQVRACYETGPAPKLPDLAANK